MKDKELREYLKNVLDLETALYENTQVKERYKNVRTKGKPQKEVKSLPIKPEEPIYKNGSVGFFSTLIDYMPKTNKMWAICIFFSSLFLFAALIIGTKTYDEVYWSEEWVVLFVLFLFLAVAFLVPVLCTIKKIKKAQQETETKIKEENNHRNAQYIEAMNIYQNSCKEVFETNKDLENQYNNRIRLYNAQTNETNKNLAHVESELRDVLNKLYDENVIYGKYRNFVAVATLYEYIDSGRCSELEGANGAYNLLESEIRADRIISSLNRIVTNLEDIKNNQYTLYKSIECANIATINILSNINNTQAMTAYYAKQAAVAASADRFIVGMTW